MDRRRFDAMIRAMAEERRSRRGAFKFVAGAALAGLLARAGVVARTVAATGCLKVDKPCRRARQCCAGICRGPRGKKTCHGHGAGTCKQQGPGVCTAPDPALVSCDNDSRCGCTVTTAGTRYCADFHVPSGCPDKACSDCADCERDADCVALGFPPGSACAPFSAGRCAGICEQGTKCLVPCGSAPETA